MNDLVKNLMAGGGLGWPAGGLGVAWSDFTIQEPYKKPSGIWRLAGLGWLGCPGLALGWPGLAGLAGYSGLAGLAGLARLANRNLMIW